jgi:hypothetical protein
MHGPMNVKLLTAILSIFNIYGFLQRSNILVYKSQHDAHVTEFNLSGNCSTRFGRHHHPSSVAQNNRNYSIW